MYSGDRSRDVRKIFRLVELRRQRLLERIAPEFQPGMVLLVTGGPGTGKTYFIRQLVEKVALESAWLDCRRLGCHTTSLARHLQDQLCRLWPGLAAVGRERELALPGQSSLQLIDALLDELLIQADKPAMLVLDSCDLLASSHGGEELLALLLRRLPGFVSLVLGSRTPLSLALAPLRLEGRLLEIDDRELLFDQEEAIRFLQDNIHPPAKDRIDRIYREAGGWPAGLALCCMENEPDAGRLIGEGREHLYEYIDGEIFRPLPLKSKRFLCAAALVQPLDSRLLGKVLPKTGAEMEALVRAFPFFFELHSPDPDSDGWRFAGLYGEFFRKKASAVLEEAEVAALHQRAAKFFTACNEYERALFHLISRRDWPGAVRLLVDGRQNWFDELEYERFLSWTEQLPPQVIDRSMQLGLLIGQAHLYRGDIDQAEKSLKKILEHAKTGSGIWMESGCRLAEVLLLGGNLEEAVALTETLVARSRRFSRLRVEARMFQAIGLHLLCRFDECDQIWRRIATIARARILPLDQATRCYLLAPKAVFYNLERGEFAESERILDDAAKVFKQHDPRKRLGWVLLFKGVLKLELHHYNEAEAWFRESVRVSERDNRSVHAASMAFLSYMIAWSGRRDEARQWLERAEPLAENDLTMWAPVLCALGQALLASKDRDTVRELRLAWNLARQRHMFLPVSLCAYTAFVVRGRMPRQGPAPAFCNRAAELNGQWQVAHREAQLLLYTCQMERENGVDNGRKSFDRAMALIAEKRFGFLLTNDIHVDGLNFVVEAIERNIGRDYFFELCAFWGREGCARLEPVFGKAPVALRRKIGSFWVQNRYRAARPLLDRYAKESTSQKTSAHFATLARKLQALPPDPLHIRMFGAFSLVRGQEPVPETAWNRRSALKMFKILCLNPHAWHTVDQLAETLWPGCSPEKARTSLWTAASTIRSAIEPELAARSPSSYLRQRSGAYRLRLPSGSTLDTVEFQARADRGFQLWQQEEATSALLVLTEAAELYRDDLLPEDIYEPWSDMARDRLRLVYLRVLSTMADIHLSTKDPAASIALHEKILTLDPLAEESYFALMRCHVLLDREVEALRVYRRCEQVLARDLSVAPSRKLQELHARIIARRSGKGSRTTGE